MPKSDIRKALDELDREVAQSLEVIELDHSQVASAVQLTRTHRLRAADALQLAAALTVRQRRVQEEFVFVSGDLELNAAAVAEGLRVENPTEHP